MPGQTEQPVRGAHVALGQHHVAGDCGGVLLVAAVGHEAVDGELAGLIQSQFHIRHRACSGMIA